MNASRFAPVAVKQSVASTEYFWRITLFETYEQWLRPTKIDFETILGPEAWDHYWSLCEDVVREMAEAQVVADEIKGKIVASVRLT